MAIHDSDPFHGFSEDLLRRIEAAIGPEGGGPASLYDRALAGFGSTQGGKSNIIRNMGSGRQTFSSPEGLQIQGSAGREPFNPPGFELGDVAGFISEVPTIIGGIGGALIGTPASPIAGPIMGASLGGAGGEYVKQKIGQALGSEEDVDPMKVAVEGALSLGGEIVGGGLGKIGRGIFARGRATPAAKRTIRQLEEFDTRFDTNLEDAAPPDVLAQSDALKQITQRIRESPHGGQLLREGQDEPFQREVERGFDAIVRESGAAGPPGTRGPFADRVGESQAGIDLKETAESTLKARRQEQGELFDAFRGLTDPTAAPDLSQTQTAIAEILQTNVMRRKKTGSAGLEGLRDAIEEAQEITTFDELVTHRQAVADIIDNWDPAQMSGGAQAQLKRLQAALKADETAFLEFGGAVPGPPGGSAQLGQVGEAPAPLFDLPFDPDFVADRIAGEAAETAAERTASRTKGGSPNQILAQLGGLRQGEIKDLIKQTGAEAEVRRKLGQLSRGTKGPDARGITIEEFLEEATLDPGNAQVLSAAGIFDRASFMEAVNSGEFFKRQAFEAIDDLGAEQLRFARGQVGDIEEALRRAQSAEELDAAANQAVDAFRSGVIDEDRFLRLRDIAKKTEDVLRGADEIGAGAQPDFGRAPDLSGTTVTPGPGPARVGGSPEALEAGRKANVFSRDLFSLDESDVSRRLLKNEEKLSEIPTRLRAANADEIKVFRQAIGIEGTEGGLRATADGRKAWEKIAAEVLDDIKQKSRDPASSTRDHFVISGAKLETELRLFGKDKLDAIFGPETADDLLNFADMVKGATVAERKFANFSGTARANQSVRDIAEFFTRPAQTTGKIIGRMFAENLAGKILSTQRGKRLMLGTTGFQRKHPGLIEFLGRAAGQTGAQTITHDPSTRPRR